MTTNTQLILGAILESENVIIITLFTADCHVDIEIKGDVETREPRIRSHYSVGISVNGKKVAKSTISKPFSPLLKWEWNANNKMWVPGLVIDFSVDIHFLESACSRLRQ